MQLTEDQVPHSPEAERSVLGAILIDNGAAAKALALLEVVHFFTKAHAATFDAMIRLWRRATPIDPVTLRDELQGAGELDVVGGQTFLASLIDGVPHSSRVEHYAAIVKEKAVRRALMERALEYAAACTNGHETAALVEAGAELYRAGMAADPGASARCRPTEEVFTALAASSKTERGRRVATRIPPLDRWTKGGVAPGEVLTIVARPQVGKSALASKIALDAAMASERVVFHSLEMPREQALGRLVQQALDIDDAAVETLAREDWRALTPAQQTQLLPVKERIVIIDRGKSSIEHLDAAMSEARAILGGPPRLAIIDYLGLLCSGAKNLPVYQRVSEAAVDVKSFAKRHQVAVILLSQAGRENDARKTEGAAALGADAARDSGQVEEAADFLATLWRPALASTLAPAERFLLRNELYLRLLKNRRGGLGTARLHFEPATLAIADWPAPEQQEAQA